MSEYPATIEWQRGEQVFSDKRYSRKHTWRFDGGLSLPASSSPHVVPLPYSDPSAVDPEEAFIAALSSCHLLWFLSIAVKKGFRVDSYQDNALGWMEKNEQGRLAITRVTLRPRVVFSGERLPSRAEIEAMHEEAHAECYIANSVKSEVNCAPVFAD
jgi:organic hydroperoxide reductase OsmC/OhrA